MAAGLPTPADVPAGHAVRVLVFRQFHYSPVMSPGEALQVAEKLEHTIEAAGGTYAMVPFQLADGAVTRLRARSVVDVGATMLDGSVMTEERARTMPQCRWRRIGRRWERGCTQPPRPNRAARRASKRGRR